MTKKENKTVKIKQVKSTIGASEKQVKVVRALGLKKKDQIVEHQASATIMGMVNKVSHIVSVVE
ncbi:50S ribosomal protein L30 [bacterium]|nr:50S ribosomal protein L30 [bacterium]